ncbi:MAG: hypothetical protein AAGD11_13970 [Planctomycetota bacterium]
MRPTLLLFCVYVLPAVAGAGSVDFPVPRQVDERRAAQVGLRKIMGRHLRLYTDLPADSAVDELAAVFDAAVARWAEYFEIDLSTLSDWKMQGYLMQDKAKFAALGLLPTERTDFANGYCNGYELWLVEQPSDYYRRHLLLHEGTHGFMYTRVGAPAIGWYAEGMAELLGTHRWQHGELTLGVMPVRREDVPMWGRIRLLREAARAGESLQMQPIMQLDNRRAFSTREYAWCWALCQFLDSHPRWQAKFRNLRTHVGEQSFNKRVRYELHRAWPDLLVEWDAFIRSLDYGYDSKRMMMRHQTAKRVGHLATTSMGADGGWQSTGWQLEAGQAYQVTAVGRYEIARETDEQGVEAIWPCEPGGITIKYHEGRPLGMLVGAWREARNGRFSDSFPIGLDRTLKPSVDAVLYLRVNDSPASLSDNTGTLTATIRRAGD